jgi:hypothetical protein
LYLTVSASIRITLLYISDISTQWTPSGSLITTCDHPIISGSSHVFLQVLSCLLVWHKNHQSSCQQSLLVWVYGLFIFLIGKILGKYISYKTEK